MDSETVPPSEATTKAAALPETTLSANMSDTEPVVLGKHRFNKEDLEQDEMAETSILLSISDDNDDDEPVVVTEKRSKQNRPRRSPNRDDSDSEDDDENSKTGKNNNSDDTESEFSFNIETDEEYHTSGFKVGFSEDRNKRFRRTMEDAHTINTTFIDEGGAFFAVFDGHAGRAAADFCGQRMQLILKDLITANPTKNISALLNETFLQIDTELAQKKGLHSGCTAAVAFTRFETRDGQKVRVLYTANVGDARTVLSRGGKAVRLSFDHKGSDPAESRRIIQSGGFMMNGRVNGVLAVTRSLGDLSMKEWVIGAAYTTETVLDTTDDKIIIACDGIWDVCPDQEAIDMIKDIDDPQEGADTLVDFALDNRSTDNLTAIVVLINHDAKFYSI